MNDWDRQEGALAPPGVSWSESDQAWNFVIYARQAKRVTLLLYSDVDSTEAICEYPLDPLRNRSGPIWHCRVARHQAPHATYYGYRVAGPITEGSWHCFDEHKILLDPYAKAVHFPRQFDRQAAIEPGPNDGKAPLGVLHTACPVVRHQEHPIRHGSDLVIYEMHVKGFTQHPSSGVPAARRGTFAGAVDKIPYLQQLGVTAVELMPVFQFDPQEGNYWGYMTLNFFAPHDHYSAHTGARQQCVEFRDMVNAFHAAGIEVILDVVYNHTCEGDERGPTYSFKGIDNALYYLRSDQGDHPYANFSGCGNTLNANSIAVQKLIIDSLRYWHEEMGVDGFRFDLASIFARRGRGPIDHDHPPVFGQITAGLGGDVPRLIAEPWDAAGTFQLGKDFPGWLWMQWNSAYRDTLQRFVRGDAGMVGDMMSRLYGSADLFPDDPENACRPWQSINYITSHDGSTFYDLVSYEKKYNWANGHNNTDGCHEFKWNCGWEGDQGVPPEVVRLRKQQVKNLFCLLLLSNGVPMFRMGDEFLQTQHGNNNAYNQDNETSWLDWRRRDAHHDLHRFVRLMITFRKSHPTLGRAHFWRDDVRWYGVGHDVDMTYQSHTLAYYLDGASAGDADLYVMINGFRNPLRFAIQEGEPGQWHTAVMTAATAPNDIAALGAEPRIDADALLVPAHSVAVLVRQR